MLPINIKYDNNKVEQAFSDFSKMKKKHGEDLTKQIKYRLDHLVAMPNFQEYLTLRLGNPHSLEGDLKGCYGVTASGNIRIIIKPICDALTQESLSKCDEVILKGLCDYHGQKNKWIIP